MDDRQLVLLLDAIHEQTAIFGEIAVALNGMLACMRPEAPNYKRVLADFASFDWSAIGAQVLLSDADGVAAVEWGDQTWTRRSGQGKFGQAVWFSRPDGKDADGNAKYVRLITFKDAAAAEPLPAGVAQALPERGAAPARQAPAAPPATPSAPAQTPPAQAAASAGEKPAQTAPTGAPRYNYASEPRPWSSIVTVSYLQDVAAAAQATIAAGKPINVNGRWVLAQKLLAEKGPFVKFISYVFRAKALDELTVAHKAAIAIKWLDIRPEAPKPDNLHWLEEYTAVLADAVVFG